MSALQLELEARVPADGALALRWQASGEVASYHLLFIRTGAVRAYTALQLTRATERYRVNGLSRHQRYLVAVLAGGARGEAKRAPVASSPWFSVTPRVGLEARPEEGCGLEAHLAAVGRLWVMPQDRRLTVYWELGRGFVDGLQLELCAGERVLRRLALEPEVSSLSLDAGRGCQLENGQPYAVRLQTRFAGVLRAGLPEVRCTPAPQGEERAANLALPQDHLIYPFLDLAPEVEIFNDGTQGPGPTSTPANAAPLLCCHCRGQVRWERYLLLCSGCGAEFLPTGRGDYLELARLRFGSCRCCLPKKILIQRTPRGSAGPEALVCAHSGKEHIRLDGAEGFHLIEDLPFGLCQCCRPRRPLVRKGEGIRCSRSDEVHQRAGAGYVLAPSQPIFDAAAIDELLDAGLAEICDRGITRGKRRT